MGVDLENDVKPTRQTHTQKSTILIHILSHLMEVVQLVEFFKIIHVRITKVLFMLLKIFVKLCNSILDVKCSETKKLESTLSIRYSTFISIESFL